MLTNHIKKCLYNAVSKYKHEIIELNEETRNDVKKIVSVAKKLGFTTENRNKNGLNELILFYNGKWIINFYKLEGDSAIHAEIDEYELLTGQALKDHAAYEKAVAEAEIDADRRMSLYNSGYRDF